jgi:hypothetical protein
VNLTPHLHLVLGLRINGDIRWLLVREFTGCTRTTLPLLFVIKHNCPSD